MGKFITFEGGEGCGKSTLIQGLKDYFDKHDVNYVATREPGGLPLCEDIRNILKYSKQQISKRAEFLLFSASRAQLVEDFIRPQLESGKIVICDRFLDSSRVYQGFANGLADADIMAITNFATGGLMPDLTFYLDIDPQVAFDRKGGRDKDDRIEKRDITYHQNVRLGYQKIAKSEKRFVVLDATMSKQQILDAVLEKLRKENIIE
jgi:dTMP kinase